MERIMKEKRRLYAILQCIMAANSFSPEIMSEPNVRLVTELELKEIANEYQ
jgi:hypothetical protein